MTDRTNLALPTDVVRLFDSTVSQAQIDADTFQNTKDDADLLFSFIEDAEDEFHDATNASMRIGREGVAGARETYEQITYDVSGHEQYKRSWTGVAGDYRNTERTTDMANERVLPFDPDEGDQAYVYRGMGTGLGGDDDWEDVTDEQGDIWDIINHRDGRLVISPVAIQRAMRTTNQGLSIAERTRLREVRFAISYRYGGLGGSRDTTSETNLSNSLAQGTTSGTVAVADGSGFPGTSEIIVKIGREYLSVAPDPANNQMEILQRGVRGTEAVDHDADDAVQYTPPAVRKAVASRAAHNLANSSRYQKFLPDNEDDISKSDLMDNLNSTWETTIAALS
jgi:hypothetical protein